VNDVVRFCRGGDQNTVRTDAARCILNDLDDVAVLRRIECHDAEFLRERNLRRIEIRTDYAAAVRLKQLCRDKADESEAGYDDRFTKLGIEVADALQGDGSDDRERRLVVRNAVRDLRAEVFRDADEFRMVAVGCHAVADLEFRDAAPDLDDCADVAVTERQRLPELVEYRFERRHQTVGFHFVKDLLDLVRLLSGFVDEVCLAEFDQHAFRSERNERAAGPDQHISAFYLRHGDFFKDCPPVFKVLDDLFHIKTSDKKANDENMRIELCYSVRFLLYNSILKLNAERKTDEEKRQMIRGYR